MESSKAPKLSTSSMKNGFRVVGFGLSKARAILACVKELSEFVESEGKRGNSTVNINTDSLTPEQKEMMMELGLLD